MKKIYKIHSWLGLINGLWLLLLGISGSLLVYYHEIDRFINKDQLTVAPQNYTLPIDSLINIVKQRIPNSRGTNILHFPNSSTDTYEFRVYIQDGSKDMIHWWETYNIDINPHTGQIVREGYYRDIKVSFMNWLFNFHWSLHLGPIGELIIAIAGILLFINVITGLIVYKKYIIKVFLFKAPIKWTNWRIASSGLHRYVGVWALFFNILIFYSGVQMNWSAFKPNVWKPPVVISHSDNKYYPIDSLQLKVQKIYPGFVTHYLYVPFVKRRYGKEVDEVISFQGYIPGTPLLVPESASKIDFDPYTGEIIKAININEMLATLNYWDQFNDVVYSFHVGSFARSVSRVLYVFVGLTPAILSITGFMLWWRRKS